MDSKHCEDLQSEGEEEGILILIYNNNISNNK